LYIFRQIVHLTSFKTPIIELLLGIRVPKTRDLSAQFLTVTSNVGFQNMIATTHQNETGHDKK